MNAFEELAKMGYGGMTGPLTLVDPRGNEQNVNNNPQSNIFAALEMLQGNRQQQLNTLIGHHGGKSVRRNMDGTLQDMNAPRGLDSLRKIPHSWEGNTQGPISRESTPEEIALLEFLSRGNDRTTVGADGYSAIESPFGIATNDPSVAVRGAPTVNMPASNGRDGSPMLRGEQQQLSQNLRSRANQNYSDPMTQQIVQSNADLDMINGGSLPVEQAVAALLTQPQIAGAPPSPFQNEEDLAFINGGASQVPRLPQPYQTQQSTITSPTKTPDRVPGNVRFWQSLAELFQNLQPRI